MRKIYYLIVYISVLFALSCQKGPYPYITLSQVKKIDSLVHPAIKNAAFIYNGNVYYVADFDQPATQVSKDGTAFKFVKMSHDHSKFAYQNNSNIIVIIDNKGNIITTLSQYSQVKSFDWSADDKTLYVLNGSAMVYYGPSLNLPDFSYPGIPNGATMEVLSASVSMKGDFAYVVHGYDFIDGDKYELVISPANNGALVTYSNPEDDVNTMDYVNFSTNAQDLVVGYKETDLNSDSQQKLDAFTGLKSYPDFSYGADGNAGVCTPVYKSNIAYFVGGFIDFTNTSTTVTEPAAIFLGPGSDFQKANIAHNKILTKYSVSGSILYTDWK